MGWRDIKPPKPTPPGEWETFSAGNYRGWILRCGPAFLGQINTNESHDKFYSALNRDSLPLQTNLSKAQAQMEEQIINSVRAMLPAYRVIFERVEGRGKIQSHSNVTPIHGSRE